MRLRPTRIEDVPVPELSGLALAGGDRPRLLAIGDRKRVLAHATLTDGPLDWSVVDLGGYGLEREHGQFEGIATTADGKILVLCEDPPVVLVLDLDTKGVESVALAGDLFEESSSSGEGVTLLADGRLLVAKEKDPPMLVELGPLEAGAEELHTLATWKLDGVEDISDLTVSGDQLFCLSDQSRRVVADSSRWTQTSSVLAPRASGISMSPTVTVSPTASPKASLSRTTARSSSASTPRRRRRTCAGTGGADGAQPPVRLVGRHHRPPTSSSCPRSSSSCPRSSSTPTSSSWLPGRACRRHRRRRTPPAR